MPSTQDEGLIKLCENPSHSHHANRFLSWFLCISHAGSICLSHTAETHSRTSTHSISSQDQTQSCVIRPPFNGSFRRPIPELKSKQIQNPKAVYQIIIFFLTLNYIPHTKPAPNILQLRWGWWRCGCASGLGSGSDQDWSEGDRQCSEGAGGAVAQIIDPIMLRVPPSVEADHPEQSYQLYSHTDPYPDFDLYELLLHEPATAKKPSLLYDYSPPQPALSHTDPELMMTLSKHQHESETEAVRKCTCSKTRCQKNYCECFKQGLACTSACECVSCCNREKLFSRRSSGDGRGCNCQKSRCLKNYCECHLNGKRCSPACKCTHCANTALLEDCLELEATAKPNKRRKKHDGH